MRKVDEPTTIVRPGGTRSFSQKSRFLLLFFLLLTACGDRHRNHDSPLLLPPTGVIATAASGEVTLQWTAVPGAVSYVVYIAAAPGVTKATYQTLTSGDRQPVAATSFIYTGLSDGTTYYLVVTAVNAAGESAESAEVSATPASSDLPPPPQNLKAVPSDRQVTLEWRSVTGASSYFVYRAERTGINRNNWNTIVGGRRSQVSGGATTRIESDLANGTTYYFVVTALNSLGQSVESAEVAATPFAAATVPTQPTNLTASAGDAKVFLNWTPSAGASSYNLYWRNAPGVTSSNGAKISGLSGTSYIHAGLTNNTAYYYVLTAVNSIGESLPSLERSATPIPTPPPAVVTLPVTNASLSNHSATLNGQVNPSGFSGNTTVSFEYGVTTGYGTSIAAADVSGGTHFVSRSVSITGLTANTPYHYRIVASNANGTSVGADQTFVLPFLGDPHEFLVKAGGSPNDVAVADFNGDGRLDLAVVNFATNDVSVLPGAGDGTFGSATHYLVAANGVASHPEYLGVGDFNNDGRPDLIVSNSDKGTLSLLLNNGAGFNPFVSFDLWVDPAHASKTFAADLAVSDFNQDGNLDVAVAVIVNNLGKVSVRLGNGAGGLGPPVLFDAGTSPSGIIAGDFDGDHRLDLVVTNRLTNPATQSDTISLLAGDGFGGFNAPTPFSIGSGASYRPLAVASGNFNGDAALDLAVANNASSTFSVFMNNGAGGFAAPSGFAVGLQPQAVETADLNGDGKLDLIAPNFRTATESQSVTVYLGAGGGAFGPSLETPLGTNKNPVAAATGKFDGDNKLDLVVVNRSANSVSVLLGQ